MAEHQKTNQKVFLIINSMYLGDVIVTNSLCRNLKKEYSPPPDCKIVFLVNTSLYEAAKYQEGVDDVICFDKRNKHKGLIGLLKFAFSCKYRNKIDTAFITDKKIRGILLSYLLNPKHRIKCNPNKSLTKMSEINADFISALTGKSAEIIPIKYNVNPEQNFIASKLKSEYGDKDIIGLCCTSKKTEKDMPVEEAIKLINLLNQNNKTVFLFGLGDKARTFSDNLKKKGCTKFVDLINITSIYDLANIISVCKGVISVDTGTMHLSYAVNTPTVCVFYLQKSVEKWAPSKDLYNVYVEYKDFSAENLVNQLNSLIEHSTPHEYICQ